MNELRGDRFTASFRNGDIVPAPAGWCPLAREMPPPALLDRERGTTLLIDRLESDPRRAHQAACSRDAHGTATGK